MGDGEEHLRHSVALWFWSMNLTSKVFTLWNRYTNYKKQKRIKQTDNKAQNYFNLDDKVMSDHICINTRKSDDLDHSENGESSLICCCNNANKMELCDMQKNNDKHFDGLPIDVFEDKNMEMHPKNVFFSMRNVDDKRNNLIKKLVDHTRDAKNNDQELSVEDQPSCSEDVGQLYFCRKFNSYNLENNSVSFVNSFFKQKRNEENHISDCDDEATSNESHSKANLNSLSSHYDNNDEKDEENDDNKDDIVSSCTSINDDEVDRDDRSVDGLESNAGSNNDDDIDNSQGERKTSGRTSENTSSIRDKPLSSEFYNEESYSEKEARESVKSEDTTNEDSSEDKEIMIIQDSCAQTEISYQPVLLQPDTSRNETANITSPCLTESPVAPLCQHGINPTKLMPPSIFQLNCETLNPLVHLDISARGSSTNVICRSDGNGGDHRSMPKHVDESISSTLAAEFIANAPNPRLASELFPIIQMKNNSYSRFKKTFQQVKNDLLCSPSLGNLVKNFHESPHKSKVNFNSCVINFEKDGNDFLDPTWKTNNYSLLYPRNKLNAKGFSPSDSCKNSSQEYSNLQEVYLQRNPSIPSPEKQNCNVFNEVPHTIYKNNDSKQQPILNKTDPIAMYFKSSPLAPPKDQSILSGEASINLSEMNLPLAVDSDHSKGVYRRRENNDTYAGNRVKDDMDDNFIRGLKVIKNRLKNYQDLCNRLRHALEAQKQLVAILNDKKLSKISPELASNVQMILPKVSHV